MQVPIFENKILLSSTVPAEWRTRLNMLAKQTTDTGTVIELFSRGVLHFLQEKAYLEPRFEWEATKAVKQIDPDDPLRKRWIRIENGYVQLNLHMSHVDIDSGRIEPQQLLAWMERVAIEREIPGSKGGRPNMQRMTSSIVKHIVFTMFPEDKFPTLAVIRKSKATRMPSEMPAELLEISPTSSRKLIPKAEPRSSWWVGFTAATEERAFLQAQTGGPSEWLRSQVRLAMAESPAHKRALKALTLVDQAREAERKAKAAAGAKRRYDAKLK